MRVAPSRVVGVVLHVLLWPRVSSLALALEGLPTPAWGVCSSFSIGRPCDELLAALARPKRWLSSDIFLAAAALPPEAKRNCFLLVAAIFSIADACIFD